MPGPEDYLNNFGQQKTQGLLGRFPQPSPAPTPARAPSFAGNDITAPRTPIFSTGTPKNIPTGVANPAPPEQGFWASLGKDGQSAALQSLLSAGNMMQQAADPEGRHPFTRLTAGFEQGLNTYDTIRRSQTLRKREEDKRAKFAAVGQAGTPLARSQAYTQAGAEIGDPSLIARGLELEGKFTPDAPTQPTVRPFGAKQGLFDETGKVIREPTAEQRAPYNIGGVGLVDNPAYDPNLPISKENNPLTQVTERQPESFTLGTGARRYEIGPGGKARIIAEGREPSLTTGKETDADTQELNKLNKIENIVWDNAKTIPKPQRTSYDKYGYLLANPNYEQEMAEYNRQVEDIRERVYGAYGVKNPAADTYTPTLNVPEPLPRGEGAGSISEDRTSFEEFAATMRAANPEDKEGNSDKALRKEYRETFGKK